ncbi:hemolysin type calcium-binding protein [Breoghania corrubedonensis]|uniref:Hemolysin type calcium-binding protein n=2 Tax=Breoghania corrubedonensis TaxID=665038 RepID=A0A2T5VFW9_9HYPH|nr:hemolysin type calcium-binding protein [Breoghania corrubedonensis]
MKDLINLDFYGLVVDQKDWDDGSGDYVDRVYVWGNTAFQINNDADFIIEKSYNANGIAIYTPRLENYYIEPLRLENGSGAYQPENFDFKTSNDDWVTQQTAETSERAIDPSGIGRTVSLTFDSSALTPKTYTVDDYLADEQKDSQYYSSFETDFSKHQQLADGTQDIFDNLFDSGISATLFDDKIIVYGTNENDVMNSYTTSKGHDVSDETSTVGIYGVYSFTFDLPQHEKTGNGFVFVSGDGADELYGGAKNDYLFAGNGDDYLFGGAGTDQMQGGGGNDFFSIQVEGDEYTVDWSYYSNFELSMMDDADVILDSDKNDTLVFDDYIETNGDIYDGTIHLDGADFMLGGGYDGGTKFFNQITTDVYSIAGLYGPRVVIGGDNYYVSLYCTIKESDLYIWRSIEDAWDGADNMNGVCIIKDFEWGDFGITLEGQGNTDDDGDDDGDGDGDGDGGSDNPVIDGTDNADVLDGTDADEELRGHDGDDTLNGEGGSDVLDGGAGADVLNGGDGMDAASYASAAGGVTVHTGDTSQNTGDAAGDQYISIEGILGSGYNDEIIFVSDNPIVYGGDGDDTITLVGQTGEAYGENGNDTLYGSSGTDALDGGAGNDILFGYEGNDTIDCGAGDDYAIGGSGDDTIYGGDGGDEIYGHEGADTIEGGAGDDILFGDGGNDRLVMGAGDDYAQGGAGNDTFVFGSDLGGNIIADFSSGDIIEFQNVASIASYQDLQDYMSEWDGTTYIEIDARTM